MDRSEWSGPKPIRCFKTSLNCCATDRHAAIQRRSRTDQPLGRLADFTGVSKALDPQERIAGRCGRESFGRGRMARRASLSARASEQRLDAGDGRTVSRHFAGHRDAESFRVCMERRRDRDEPVRRRADQCASMQSLPDSNTKPKGLRSSSTTRSILQREDVVEATVAFRERGQSVRVFGPEGREVPAQIIKRQGSVSGARCLRLVTRFTTRWRPTAPCWLRRSESHESSLENARYRVAIDKNGDVSSIFDKKLNRELLSAPIRLAISTDNPRQWPAWNMDFEDEQRAPRAFRQRIDPRSASSKSGPARVAVEVERETEGSKFVQTISLSAGDAGNRVEFSNVIDWNTKEANLKATFPLAAANNLATYNWDIGTIQRPNAAERQFEVASHQWIDLTNKGGAYGATVLTDCKNGSDKPDDQTMRLTLIRTPGTRGGYADQGTQDIGRHEITVRPRRARRRLARGDRRLAGIPSRISR